MKVVCFRKNTFFFYIHIKFLSHLDFVLFSVSAVLMNFFYHNLANIRAGKK